MSSRENAFEHHDGQSRGTGTTSRGGELSLLSTRTRLTRPTALDTSLRWAKKCPVSSSADRRLHDVGRLPSPLTRSDLGVRLWHVSQAVNLTSRRHVDLRRQAGALCRTGR
ncbi:putative leader peptide [Saccharothrix sp. NRRL B-16348]|uniref:putative leader peptide n=1 Tax=Saccharothrix sp. NRRL B-16348 TaxID=1415542 RepID=UPI003FA6B579